MAKAPTFRLADMISGSSDVLLADWLGRVEAASDPRLPAEELEVQCEAIVAHLAAACRGGDLGDINGPAFGRLRDVIVDMALSRGLQGFAASETATFLLSLKAPLFARLRSVLASEPERLAMEMLTISEMVDGLALFMMDSFQRTREELIRRQEHEISELSTPVLKLWRGILALPLIGTLDTVRTQLVMEQLLDSIARHEAVVVIIDIAEVPAIDDLVAQHLLKTIAAARLMGTECIVSGIRPLVAQTLVHLGVELKVAAKANVAEAFAAALRRVGKVVADQPGLAEYA
ncbi:MAG TPA: STAS domain-containing protein [Rhodopila sp.]|jgi:rsbT co-antagonist protein RsbR|nr:STAS domain-containing protein [Rhodopila sp.]